MRPVVSHRLHDGSPPSCPGVFFHKENARILLANPIWGAPKSVGQCRIRADIWPHDPQTANRHRCGNRVPLLGSQRGLSTRWSTSSSQALTMSLPEPWIGQDTRDRGMRCLIAPHFLALSSYPHPPTATATAPAADSTLFRNRPHSGGLAVDVGPPGPGNSLSQTGRTLNAGGRG